MGCIACAALVLEGAGIELTRKESSTIPVEADSISPDRFIGPGADGDRGSPRVLRAPQGPAR